MKSAYPKDLFVEPVAWRTTWSGRRSRILVTKAGARQERAERTLDTLTELCERRNQKGRGKGMPEQEAIALAKFPERVAAIVGKTFVCIGSDAYEGKGLTDDQAISMIKDLLDELDEGIVERNMKKSITRLRRVS
jgi:hypothetical protein